MRHLLGKELVLAQLRGLFPQSAGSAMSTFAGAGLAGAREEGSPVTADKRRALTLPCLVLVSDTQVTLGDK